MAGTGGYREGSGRKKGVPNKLNASIKEMIVGALCAAGGESYLLRQAEQNPVAFMSLLGRVLPLQVTGENGNPIAYSFRWADAALPEDNSAEPVISVTWVKEDAAE